MDQITRARENFRKQSEAYHGLLKRKETLEGQIVDLQRRLEIVNRDLPQQKMWFENSKKLLEGFGDQQQADKLKQMAQLKAEIERLSGETITVPALDQAKERAEGALKSSTDALKSLGVEA